jgi:hypothetical protein
MKERPILFNGDMVRAILSGQKTQTRRFMKVQPEPSETRPGDYWFPSNHFQSMVHVGSDHEILSECCPFGKVGDRLWVREAFACGLCTKTNLAYRATHKPEDLEEGFDEQIKWKPSIHMPRSACRIILEITDIRIERACDISEKDAVAEGVRVNQSEYAPSDRQCFYHLLTNIYGEESWKKWVWVIEFKKEI